MPNGHDYSKEYGGHSYPGDRDSTSNCDHGCGCWMGPSRSDGPVGLSPLGECPGNPKDGEKVGGNADYAIVVERRIRSLQRENVSLKEEVAETMERARKAEAVVGVSKRYLDGALTRARRERDYFKGQLSDIRDGIRLTNRKKKKSS